MDPGNGHPVLPIPRQPRLHLLPYLAPASKADAALARRCWCGCVPDIPAFLKQTRKRSPPYQEIQHARRGLSQKQPVLLSGAEKLLLKVPASFSELHAVRHTLELYRRACPGKVALLLLSIYIFCQARIPILVSMLYGLGVSTGLTTV